MTRVGEVGISAGTSTNLIEALREASVLLDRLCDGAVIRQRFIDELWSGKWGAISEFALWGSVKALKAWVQAGRYTSRESNWPPPE
jgi:hypothetical protein